MKKVNALAIRTDGGTQVRFKLHEEKVGEYADLMNNGTIFPPVVVFHDGVDYWLADGFHRFFAYKKNGTTAIDCDVRQGTLEDAKQYARTANNDHGIPLTLEEQKAIARYFFTHPEFSKLSTRQLAKEMKKSHMTIGRWRSEMDAKPVEVTYVKGDKTITMPTKNIGNNNKSGKKDTPSNKKESAVTPVTAPKEDSDDRFKELTHTIEDLHKELTAAKDVIASKRWDATEFEQEDLLDTVQQLREEIKIKDMEIATLKDSRDMFQQKNAELIRQVNSLKKKIGV